MTSEDIVQQIVESACESITRVLDAFVDEAKEELSHDVSSEEHERIVARITRALRAAHDHRLLIVELSSPSGHMTCGEVQKALEDQLQSHEESIADEVGCDREDAHITAMVTIDDHTYDIAAHAKSDE